MSKFNLKEMKEECYQQLIKWSVGGKKLGTYRCNHCTKDIPCMIPDKKDVSSKGFWDSATICLECGRLNFVKKYPNGKTESRKMG